MAQVPWTTSIAAATQLPPCSDLARLADTHSLEYMRAPSVKCEYVPVPLVKTEPVCSSYDLHAGPLMLESPISPASSMSVSPTLAMACLPVNRVNKRQAKSRRSSGQLDGHDTKPRAVKRRNMSLVAETLDMAMNEQLDDIHALYKDSNRSSRASRAQRFPRYSLRQHPRENKRTIASTSCSDKNERHNVAQTYLRSEKGSGRMTLERLLVGCGGCRDGKLQTKVNARSSGLVFEEKGLLRSSIQMHSLSFIILQELFGSEGMQQLGKVCHMFEPEEVRPATVFRDPQDDDKTYDFKCQQAKVDVIAAASEPLGLKRARSQEELLDMIREHVMPLANPMGKQVFQQMMNKGRCPQARL